MLHSVNSVSENDQCFVRVRERESVAPSDTEHLSLPAEALGKSEHDSFLPRVESPGHRFAPKKRLIHVSTCNSRPGAQIGFSLTWSTDFNLSLRWIEELVIADLRLTRKTEAVIFEYGTL